MAATIPFSHAPDGVRAAVRLTPGAGDNRIDGIAAFADGKIMLKARVTAAPEKGKANAALIKLLSKNWGIPKSSMSVVSGRTDRNKSIQIDGEPNRLMAELRAWLANHTSGEAQ